MSQNDLTTLKRKDLTEQESLIQSKKAKLQESAKKLALINHENFDQLAARLKKTPSAPQWSKIGIRHHFGVNVPVFSLKSDSNGSCGVGEYLDLIPLIDWCKANKFDIIQTLPLNDTNPYDNSPFSPISSFSLNPRLISLKKLPNFNKQTDEMKSLIDKLMELNKAARVQWKEVNEMKIKWLWAYFTQKDQQEMLKSKEYKDYVAQNSSWLRPYGIFCLLKRIYSWKHWSEWSESKELENFTPSDSIMDLPFAKKLMEKTPDSDDVTLGNNNLLECEFYMFMQYLASDQLKRVRAHAESQGVFLKGDIPFLVSGDSVDVWLNRKFFIMERTAGAPPDMYSADGQNWGVPIYNWEAIKADNYTWWKNRLQTANQYFHLFRIDHVVGFFRVWAIPTGLKGTDGSFEPAEESKWIPQGEEIMRMIVNNCTMLPIGEDLGTVPIDVKLCLQRLGICGTKVVRWERNWDDAGKPFIPYEEYNADSMTTVSTHDSETVTQWWANAEEDIIAYNKFNGMKKEAGTSTLSTEQRKQILKESHTTPSLFHISLINEYLALVPSFSPSDPNLERVNLPGQVSDANWSYRMLPSIETVASNATLSGLLKEINEAPVTSDKIDLQKSNDEKKLL